MSTATAVRTAESVLANQRIVSADSHIMEPSDLWDKNLTPSLKAKYPKFPPRSTIGEKPGGYDPNARIGEMEVDGVTAEVLYPTFGLRLFALEDAELQEGRISWEFDLAGSPRSSALYQQLLRSLLGSVPEFEHAG